MSCFGSDNVDAPVSTRASAISTRRTCPRRGFRFGRSEDPRRFSMIALVTTRPMVWLSMRHLRKKADRHSCWSIVYEPERMFSRASLDNCSLRTAQSLGNTSCPRMPLELRIMPFTASQRPTREWPWLVLALAIVGAVCIPLWQYTQDRPAVNKNTALNAASALGQAGGVPTLWQAGWTAETVLKTPAPQPSKWTAERLSRLFLGPEQIICYASLYLGRLHPAQSLVGGAPPVSSFPAQPAGHRRGSMYPAGRCSPDCSGESTSPRHRKGPSSSST